MYSAERRRPVGGTGRPGCLRDPRVDPPGKFAVGVSAADGFVIKDQ